MRNYLSNHNYSNSISFNANNVSQNFNSANNINNVNISNKSENNNLPKIQDNENKKNFTLIKNKSVIKEGNLSKFIHSKNKIKQRLEIMSREKMSKTNNTFGKRVIIKDLKNTVIDDGLSRTTKGFNMN